MVFEAQHEGLARTRREIEEAQATHARVVGVFEAFDYNFQAPRETPGFFTMRMTGL